MINHKYTVLFTTYFVRYPNLPPPNNTKHDDNCFTFLADNSAGLYRNFRFPMDVCFHNLFFGALRFFDPFVTQKKRVGKLINLGSCYSDMMGSCQALWALRVDVKRPQCLGRMNSLVHGR